LEFKQLRELIDQSFEGICYRAIAPGRRSHNPLPKFMNGAKPEQFEAWFFGDDWVPEVGLFNIANLHLLSDRILVRNNNFLCLDENGIVEGSIRAMLTPGFGQGQHVLRIAEEVVLLPGPGQPIYGHWLVDFLPRLFCLEQLGYNISDLRYLLPASVPPFAKEWLAAIGISDRQIIFYDPQLQQCAISRALLPTNLRGYNLANPLLVNAIKFLKTRLRLTGSSNRGRKIFISRTRWKNLTRQLKNGFEIESFFAARGFEIQYPETLSIREQVRLFSECSIIAGEYGSGMHNTVFAPAGAKIILLRGNHAVPWFLQSGLCDIFGHDCSYVFGATDIVNGLQVFNVALADIAECLDHECAS